MPWELQGTEQAELLSHKASFSSLQVGEIHAGQGGGRVALFPPQKHHVRRHS